MGTEKTEIEKLPEGVNSDRLDEIMTDDTIDGGALIKSGNVEETNDTEVKDENQEATDATSSPAEKSVETEESETAEAEAETEETTTEDTKVEEEVKEEPDPKDAVIGDFRRQLRDSEIERTKLETELRVREEVRAETKTKEPPPKSPLEIAMEAEGITDPDELQKPFSVMRAQNAWEKEQEKKGTAADKQTQVNTIAVQAEDELQVSELSVEKMGEGLDLKSIGLIGVKHLTKGDRVDIADITNTKGSKAGLREAYSRMVDRTIAAGGADAKTLQIAIDAKSKSQTKPKKEKETPSVEDDTETGEVEASAEDKISDRLFNFITTE